VEKWKGIKKSHKAEKANGTAENAEKRENETKNKEVRQ
jgi:hypothetical protein